MNSNSYTNGIAGEDYTILLDSKGTGFSFGDNSRGQLMQNDFFISTKINKIKNFENNIKEIKTSNDKIFLITKEEDVIFCNLLQKNSPESKVNFQKIHLYNKLKISSLNCGYNFIIFLTKTGILFSHGSNSLGELGLGDYISRSEPMVVNFLIEKKEKIADVECGFKHVLARDTLGKVYSWGNVNIF